MSKTTQTPTARDSTLGKDDSVFTGAIIPMITPYMEGNLDKVDTEGARKLAAYFASTRAGGLFVLGGTGQWLCLSHDEKLAIMDAVLEGAAGRTSVTVHVGSADGLETTLRLVEAAREREFDGIGVVTPLWLDYDANAQLFVDQNALYDYFKAVHDACDLPMMIYDRRPGLTVETTERLAALDRVVSIKYRSDQATEMFRRIRCAGGRFKVLAGIEWNTLATLAMGGVGVIGGGGNVYPDLMADLIDAWNAREIERARDLQARVNEASGWLGHFGSEAWGLKTVLREVVGVPIAISIRPDPVEGSPPPPVTGQAKQRALDYFKAMNLPTFSDAVGG